MFANMFVRSNCFISSRLSSRLLLLPHGIQRPTQSRRRATISAVLSSRSSNPAFTMGRIDDAVYQTGRGERGEVMTTEGVALKTSALMLVALAAAAYQWTQIFSGSSALALSAMNLSKVAGIVGIATLTIFKPNWSPVSGPIYALAKGLAVGGIAALMELRYPGMVMSAVSLTFATAASLGVCFQTGMINVNDRFKSGVTMVTGGFLIVMALSFLLTFLGVSVPGGGLLSGGPIGIVVGLISAGLASANLLVDFDLIRSCQRQRMPKWFEWYASFSLLVTLVWMFTSILRLLGLMAGSDRD